MNRVITCPLMTAAEFAQAGHPAASHLDIRGPKVGYDIDTGQGGDGFRGPICWECGDGALDLCRAVWP